MTKENIPSDIIRIGDNVIAVSDWYDSVSTFHILEGDKGLVVGYNENISSYEVELDFEGDIYTVFIAQGILFRR